MVILWLSSQLTRDNYSQWLPSINYYLQFACEFTQTPKTPFNQSASQPSSKSTRQAHLLWALLPNQISFPCPWMKYIVLFCQLHEEWIAALKFVVGSVRIQVDNSIQIGLYMVPFMILISIVLLSYAKWQEAIEVTSKPGINETLYYYFFFFFHFNRLPHYFFYLYFTFLWRPWTTTMQNATIHTIYTSIKYIITHSIIIINWIRGFRDFWPSIETMEIC